MQKTGVLTPDGLLLSPGRSLFTPFSRDQGCMRMAAANNLTLFIHHHLDDADGTGTWRNAVEFDPFLRCV
jgi:hypothetical protein